MVAISEGILLLALLGTVSGSAIKDVGPLKYNLLEWCLSVPFIGGAADN